MASRAPQSTVRMTPTGHAWYFEGMSKEQIDKVRKGFEERYGKGALK